MLNQPTILLNAILTYMGPIIEGAGYHIDPTTGLLIDNTTGQKIAYINQRYQEGISGPDVPSIISPAVPVSQEHFVVIKEDPNFEVFNPFQNLKHMLVILYKLKKVLIPFVLSPATLRNAHSEEEMDALDNLLGIYDKTDNHGYFEIGIVSNETPEFPKEVIKAAGEEPIQAAWNLCVLIYNNYVATDQKKLRKEFSNLDMSWKKIKRRMLEWDKERKEIAAEAKLQNKSYVDNSNEMMDFSANEGYNPEVPYPIMMQPTSYVSEDEMQNFLTSLFDPSDLKPYTPPVTTDEVASVEDQVLSVEGSVPGSPAESEQLEAAQDAMNKMLLSEMSNEIPSVPETSIEQASIVQEEFTKQPEGILNQTQSDIGGMESVSFGSSGRLSDIPEEPVVEETPTKLVLGGGNMNHGQPMTRNPQIMMPGQQQMGFGMNPFGAGMQNPMMGGMQMNSMMGMGNMNPFGAQKSFEETDLSGGMYPNPYGF